MTPAAHAGTNRLLGALPQCDLERWLPRLELVTLVPGQLLYESGQVPLHAYFPTTAVVSLLYMTQGGECDEVAVVGREGVVGVSVFMGGRATPGTAVVQRAGEAFRMQSRTIKEEFEASPAVMHVLLEYSLALSVQVAQTAVCNRHHMLDQRLARRLLQGLDQQQESELELVMTQEQLAGLLGVRRESITVEALKLQKAGIVRYSRGHIHVLDRVALESVACECYAVVKGQFDPGTSQDANWPAALLPLLEQSRAGLALAPSLRPSCEELAACLQQIRVQVRGDLARELEENLGSLLAGAKLEIATLKARLAGASSDVRLRLQHLSQTIDRGLACSRDVVECLQPSSLATLGLAASLGILARHFGANSGMTLATDLEEADIDAAAQRTLYGVVEQALDNASKYAKAGGARVVLLDCGTEIVMTVSNEGDDRDAPVPGPTRRQVSGMRRRVESCGGQLTVSTDTARGTLIAAVLPKRGTAGPVSRSPACRIPVPC